MKRDDIYLRHMLDVIAEIETYAAKDRGNSLVRRGVERCLEILGEAANQLSSPLQQKHPEVSWAGIVGLRNRIIHQYFRVDYEIIWEVVDDEIPRLKRQVEVMLKEITAP